jgi:hypothetical protein
VLSTLLLGAVSNALDVQFIPDSLRAMWQTGIRERLWNSRARRVARAAARRAGAVTRAWGGVFRATEAALGVAASSCSPRCRRPTASSSPSCRRWSNRWRRGPLRRGRRSTMVAALASMPAPPTSSRSRP